MTKNGNGTRWTIGILVSVSVVLGCGVAGWTLNHHEADMVEATKRCGVNAAQLGVVSDRTVRLDADMTNLKSDVAEIKADVKRILARMPG